LLVGYRRANWLIECKPNIGAPSKRKLRDTQVKWHHGWKGQVATVETPEAALAVIGAIGLHLAGSIGDKP
jgi:hypothetical protein